MKALCPAHWEQQLQNWCLWSRHQSHPLVPCTTEATQHSKTPHWSRGKVWRGRSGNDEAFWIECSSLPPTLPSTMLLREGCRRVEKEVMKLSLGRREGWEVLLVLSLFSLSYTIFNWQYINLPLVEFAIPLKIIGEWFACRYLNPWRFHLIIFSPSPVKEDEWKILWVGTC